MNIETGIGGSAYLGAAYYSVENIHGFDILQMTFSDSKTVGDHLIDWAWWEVWKKHCPLNRSAFLSEIRYAGGMFSVTFYNRHEYLSAKRKQKR